jgi:hypothetical protein
MRGRPILIPVLIEGSSFPEPLGELGTRINAIANKMDYDQIASEISSKIRQREKMPKIFISHAHADEEIVDALVDVLKQAFEINIVDIRATSLPGHKLSIGAVTPEQLRREIEISEVVMGIITPNSIQSEYVLFELGASWGLEKSIYPLLALGATPENLPGTLKERNCIELSNHSSCHELITQLKSQAILPARDNNKPHVDKAIHQLVEASSKPTVDAIKMSEGENKTG